jgi:hypothetical protein
MLLNKERMYKQLNMEQWQLEKKKKPKTTI